MPSFKVLLAAPKYAGNVGAVARSMMNFGFHDLIIVDPTCNVEGNECRNLAVHAQQIIDDAVIVNRFEEAAEQVDFLAGTSAIITLSDKRHLRQALSVKSFARQVFDLKGVVGLAFGREDYGLLNEEIEQCDMLLTIPTHESYPSLNLSHATTVVFYELFSQHHDVKKQRQADRREKEMLYQSFDSLLERIDYPAHKKKKTAIMFKRIIGRAMLSKWEYHTLMGVLKRA